jgi:hypothetical protein
MADRGNRTTTRGTGEALRTVSTTGRHDTVVDEAYTYTQTCQRDTERITPSGTQPRQN